MSGLADNNFSLCFPQNDSPNLYLFPCWTNYLFLFLNLLFLFGLKKLFNNISEILVMLRSVSLLTNGVIAGFIFNGLRSFARNMVITRYKDPEMVQRKMIGQMVANTYELGVTSVKYLLLMLPTEFPKISEIKSFCQ